MRYSRPSRRPGLIYKHRMPNGFIMALPKQPKSQADIPRFVVVVRHDLVAIREAVTAEALQLAQTTFRDLWPIHQAEPGATIQRTATVSTVVTLADKERAARQLAGASSVEEFAAREIAARLDAVTTQYGYGDIGRWQLYAQAATEAEANEYAESARRGTLRPVAEARVEPFNFGWFEAD